MNKPLRILAGRAQLLGDTISAIPIAVYFRKLYPDAYIIWPIAKKTAQGAPLYINNPAISEIFVFDGQEGPESKRDWDLINSCDIKINPNPNHPDSRYPAEFTIYSETWRMAGLSMEQWNSLTPDEQRPKLYKWWNEIKAPKKTISYFPCAGYGVENKRNASEKWCAELITELISSGYKIWQFGAERDYRFEQWDDISAYERYNHLSFFEQIKLSLSTDLMIGTDSGSALIIGAYEHPQISLLTNHWPGIEKNHYALAVNNPNNTNFFGLDSADNISIDKVIQKIVELVP